MRKRGAGRGINDGRREDIPYYIIYREGGGGRENGTDAGSESRSKIYFDYAEQQGGKNREAGLKRKTIRGLCALSS